MAERKTNEIEVSVCLGPDCSTRGSEKLLVYLQNSFHDTEGITIAGRSCLNRCGEGPNVLVEKGSEQRGEIYTGVGRKFFGIPTGLRISDFIKFILLERLS